MNPIYAKFIRELQYHSPWRRYFFPRYKFNFTPPQLCYLCQCLEATRDVKGAYAEVGCAAGRTTVFLNKYMDAQDIEKDYYAVDTFNGFVSEDVEYEVDARGKPRELMVGFRANKKKWFDATMRQNRIDRVHSIQADVNKFDLSTLGPLAFVLLDVDLYRPTKKALKELYAALSPGGIIVVDDCDASNIRWDGADQAYKEFMIGLDIPPTQIFHNKLGFIKKPVYTHNFPSIDRPYVMPETELTLAEQGQF